MLIMLILFSKTFTPLLAFSSKIFISFKDFYFASKNYFSSEFSFSFSSEYEKTENFVVETLKNLLSLF